LKDNGEFLMIGRRDLRSNNSWMHNSEWLVKGPSHCTLLMHPEDAAMINGFEDTQIVCARSRNGKLVVPLEVSDVMMRGVVSLPHGWGHPYKDTRITIA
jgi:anaerobic selenocysteine-containing dehydrogenase